MSSLPKMLAIRQKFPKSPPLNIGSIVAREFDKVRGRIKPGMRIAVGVGSRGISNLFEIVSAVVGELKAAGAKPFIIPAMGSHGGATPEGQKEILAEYKVTEQSLGIPIHAAMEADSVGKTKDGHDVFVSVEAMRADGIVVVNRVKPHTDFSSDTLGSGVIKMMVIGLGKRIGATSYHRAALHHGFEAMLRKFAPVVLDKAPILCGVAIVEDYFHETARIAVLPREDIEKGEALLFAEAKRLMPKLPFEEIDLLIIDQIGKNISGSGMDPNIIGREIFGYSTAFADQAHLRPVIHRIFVRDLTPETLGNAIGIGLADFTTTRLIRAMDAKKTFVNALTSLSSNAAKTPIHFETDREAVQAGVASLAIDDDTQAKIVRIRDTLSLEKLEISEPYAKSLDSRRDLELLRPAQEIEFDQAGNLAPLQ